MKNQITVAIGSDHRGIQHRKLVSEIIQKSGLVVHDTGTHTEGPCDYPDIAESVSKKVVSGECNLGILVCGTGIGMSIAANKITGIRAAVCKDAETASLSRQHNDANILCLATNHFQPDQFEEIITAWLDAEFEGGRHARRLDKVADIESKNCDNGS
ncbi:MAG: ribose 5-phosphate isomerase B [Planctomycetota bacterium]